MSFLFILSLASCDKINQDTQFSTDYIATFIIPADEPVQQPIDLDEVTIQIDNQIFENYHASKDLLEEASIKSINLQINPKLNDGLDLKNLDFLTNASLYIQAEGLPKVRIAWVDNLIDSGTVSIDMDYLRDNLSEYFKKDQLQLSLTVYTNKILTQQVIVDINIELNLMAKVLGQ